MSAPLRPLLSSHPDASILNPWHAALTGLAGGRIKLLGDDGVETNPLTGATTSNNHALKIQSDVGLHVLVRNAADSANVFAVEDAAVTLTTNLAFSGTGRRITGDWTNATAASRVLFQTSTANSATNVGALPSGTGVAGAFTAFGSSDPAASAWMQIATIAGTDTRVVSGHTGASYLPLLFFNNGVEQMRIATTGPIIGTATNQVGFYGSAGVVKPAAYTQTYATATRTHANPTATTVTNAFGSQDGTYQDTSATSAAIANNFQECATKINQLIVDIANIKQVLNAVVDDHQAMGLA